MKKKEITLSVLEGTFTRNNGTDREKIDTEYLLDSIEITLDNNESLCNRLLSSRRSPVSSIVWDAFLMDTNNRIKGEHPNYEADSSHLKAYINNDYSILKPLIDKKAEEREEAIAERKAEEMEM